MFEATLDDPDHQRLQRLIFAAAVTLATTATALAGLWTLERMNIDRVGGPNSPGFELLQLSVLPPPKLIKPPPPPPVIDDDTRPSDPDLAGPVARGDQLEEAIEPTSDSDVDDTASEVALERGISGIPTGNDCPGGACRSSLIPTAPDKPCVGPGCGTSSPPPGIDSAAPVEVEFSALHCFACPDPDQDRLRKTGAGVRKRSGRVVANFCVDVRGRVEPRSIEISRGFGDAAVDTITRDAIARWRFSPMKVSGKPRRACSRADFTIRFQ